MSFAKVDQRISNKTMWDFLTVVAILVFVMLTTQRSRS
jgi:hypothetical protein